LFNKEERTVHFVRGHNEEYVYLPTIPDVFIGSMRIVTSAYLNVMVFYPSIKMKCYFITET